MFDFKDILEIYADISQAEKNVKSRLEGINIRKNSLSKINNIVKVAFDTRRIDQEADYNPRRNLQNYHRSDPFISQAMTAKIKNLIRIKNILEELKNRYGAEDEWQDSYSRILLNNIDKAIRTNQQDGDFTDSQMGVGSLDYLEELLYVRYRLVLNDLDKITDEQIKSSILDKDEELTKKDLKNYIKKDSITRHDITTQNYDTLLEKLFGNVKASEENPEVMRTVTITINDKFVK